MTNFYMSMMGGSSNFTCDTPIHTNDDGTTITYGDIFNQKGCCLGSGDDTGRGIGIHIYTTFQRLIYLFQDNGIV